MTEAISNTGFSRKDMELAGAALILIGVWAAIILLPIVFVSILFLTLLVSAGVLLCYEAKRIRHVLNWVSTPLGITAWAYLWTATVSGYSAYYFFLLEVYSFRGPIGDRLFIESFQIVVPIAALVTIALTWFGRRKLAQDHKTWTAFKRVAVFTLLIGTPLIIGGLHDYNKRADTSPPQLIPLKVVDKWTEAPTDPWDPYEYWLKGETLAGKTSYSFRVTHKDYNGEYIGSWFEITVRSGALGYPWLEYISATPQTNPVEEPEPDDETEPIGTMQWDKRYGVRDRDQGYSLVLVSLVLTYIWSRFLDNVKRIAGGGSDLMSGGRTYRWVT